MACVLTSHVRGHPGPGIREMPCMSANGRLSEGGISGTEGRRHGNNWMKAWMASIENCGLTNSCSSQGVQVYFESEDTEELPNRKELQHLDF